MHNMLSNKSKISLCITCYYSSVVDFSEKYIVSTEHKNSWYQQTRYSEDAEGKT